MADILAGLNDPPQIVILSACHSADARVALMPAAQSLYDAGVETVIGMNNSISHNAAIVFFLGFFSGIVKGFFARIREKMSKKKFEKLLEKVNDFFLKLNSYKNAS